MASSPKCNGLQASIDMQLLVRGCVFDKYTHTTMDRAIIFHRRYTIVWIIFERNSFVTMEESFLYADGCGVILRYDSKSESRKTPSTSDSATNVGVSRWQCGQVKAKATKATSIQLHSSCQAAKSMEDDLHSVEFRQRKQDPSWSTCFAAIAAVQLFYVDVSSRRLTSANITLCFFCVAFDNLLRLTEVAVAA